MAVRWITASGLLLPAPGPYALDVRFAQQPHMHGAVLSNEALSTIRSVDCLKAMQQGLACGGADSNPHQFVGHVGHHVDGPLSISEYPHWSSLQCRSDNYYFCDPNAVLDDDQRFNITASLLELRDTVNVTCLGAGNSTDVVAPFTFGVALADVWPVSQTDAASLRTFGNVLLQQWGFIREYNGIDSRESTSPSNGTHQADAICPAAAAILIAIPSARAVYVSAPTCDYICTDHIAPKIVAAVQEAWRNGQATAVALQAGIDVARHELEAASLRRGEKKDSFQQRLAKMFPYDWVCIAAAKAIYVGAVVALTGSVLVFCFVCIHTVSTDCRK